MPADTFRSHGFYAVYYVVARNDGLGVELMAQPVARTIRVDLLRADPIWDRY